MDSRRAPACTAAACRERTLPASVWAQLTSTCADSRRSAAQEEQLDSALPLLGIAATVGGYTVMEAQADVLECVVTEGLTEDAVTARLHEGVLSHHPCYSFLAGYDPTR